MSILAVHSELLISASTIKSDRQLALALINIGADISEGSSITRDSETIYAGKSSKVSSAYPHVNSIIDSPAQVDELTINHPSSLLS